MAKDEILLQFNAEHGFDVGSIRKPGSGMVGDWVHFGDQAVSFVNSDVYQGVGIAAGSTGTHIGESVALVMADVQVTVETGNWLGQAAAWAYLKVTENYSGLDGDGGWSERQFTPSQDSIIRKAKSRQLWLDQLVGKPSPDSDNPDENRRMFLEWLQSFGVGQRGDSDDPDDTGYTQMYKLLDIKIVPTNTALQYWISQGKPIDPRD